MSRAVATLIALLVMGAAAPLHAQSITSFAPDTNAVNQRNRTPAGMVDVPVWIGFESSANVGASAFAGVPARKGYQQGLGVTATWPWSSALQGWFEVAYQQHEFLANQATRDTVLGPPILLVFNLREHFVLSQFLLREGVEQRIGPPDRPWATAGIGVGFGFGTASLDNGFLTGNGQSFTAEAVARVSLFAYMRRHERIGLAFVGGPAWSWTAQAERRGVGWRHAEAVLRFESMLRLPKRIVPGL